MCTSVGTVEGMAAAGEEMRSGEAPPSEEQMEAMARGGILLSLFGMLSLFFGFGTILFAFVMPGGLVANERSSAAIMLWAQHPMPLSSFYIRRYLGVQVATLAALLIFGLTASAAVLPPASAPATGVGGFVSICLEGMLACAISFGISALGLRRAALFGLVYYLPSSLVAQFLRLPKCRPRPWRSWRGRSCRS